jgi:hypothetical protein
VAAARVEPGQWAEQLDFLSANLASFDTPDWARNWEHLLNSCQGKLPKLALQAKSSQSQHHADATYTLRANLRRNKLI